MKFELHGRHPRRLDLRRIRATDERAARHDGHDLALPPNSALEAAPASAPTFSLEPTAPTEDGWLDPAAGAAVSTAIEPNTSLILRKARDSAVPDSSLDSSPDSEPSAPLPIESD